MFVQVRTRAKVTGELFAYTPWAQKNEQSSRQINQENMNNHLNWQVDDLQELILTVFNPLLITLPISKIEVYCTDGSLLLTRSDVIKL